MFTYVMSLPVCLGVGVKVYLVNMAKETISPPFTLRVYLCNEFTCVSRCRSEGIFGGHGQGDHLTTVRTACLPM